MTAKGKITAAELADRVTNGFRVRVLLEQSEVGDWFRPATRKTGVETLEITGAERTQDVAPRLSGGRAVRMYRFTTSAGRTGNCAPAQTFMLAPEDPPAVRRAHAEALEIEARRAARAGLEAQTTEELIQTHRAAQESGDVLAMMLIEGLISARNLEQAEDATRAAQERQMAGVPAVGGIGCWPPVPAWTEIADGVSVAPVGTPDPGERLAQEEIGPYSAPRPETTGTIAVVQSGPHAGSVVRTGTAMVRPFLAPTERPDQEPRYTTEQRLLQLLALLDDGTVFELHPDGWWRDRAGLTGSFLDTVALKDTVNEAHRVGLVAQMGADGRHVANPTLVPAPIHQVVGAGRGFRPLCGSTPYDRIGPMRRRYTNRADLVTCSACIDMAAEIRRAAARLTEAMTDRGVVVGATVTIHRGTQRYEVVEIAEDMARVAPILAEEDRASIEAAGGTIRELQWISWDLLHAVPA